MLSSICRFASSDRCGSTTAFGRPPVPEVKMMIAASSSSARRSERTSKLSASSPPLRSASQVPVGHPSGSFLAPRASARATWGCRRSMASLTSASPHQAFASTGTAPMFTHAQKFTIQSGLLNPSSSTRSRGSMPRSSRCADFLPTAFARPSYVRTRSPWTDVWPRSPPCGEREDIVKPMRPARVHPERHAVDVLDCDLVAPALLCGAPKRPVRSGGPSSSSLQQLLAAFGEIVYHRFTAASIRPWPHCPRENWGPT